MEFEFDKEIDALLRQAAKGETVFAANNPQSAIRNPHLDADAISAFAENALPEKMRQSYVLHFADCERCRKILSNVILLNSETEVVSEKEATKAAVVAEPTPWYRKLFAYPNLAYTMGALILAFSGLIAFVVLQNDSRNAEVSQISERQPTGKGMSSDGDAAPAETSFSNDFANTTSNTASIANSSAALSTNSLINSVAVNSNAAPGAKKSNVSPNAPKEELRAANVSSLQNKESFSLDSASGEKLAEAERKRAENNDKEVTATTDATSPAPARKAPPTKSDHPTALARSSAVSESARDDAKKAKLANNETANVGGKTFKRANGIWIDAAYKGQATTNITRGTSEYKKLDSGLRSIAENLGGTVVIVWKEKAYRIQ